MNDIPLAAALALAIVWPSAFAGVDCKSHPKSEWMKESDARARLLEQGYQIRSFKVDGPCYEVHGTDRRGRTVDVHFDTKTLEPVKTEIRK